MAKTKAKKEEVKEEIVEETPEVVEEVKEAKKAPVAEEQNIYRGISASSKEVSR